MPNLQESNAVWTEQKVIADDGAELAWFGLSVAIFRNTAFIAAKNTSVDGHSSQGAVYVFQKVGNHWSQTQKLVASDGVEGDQFGSSIALFGTTAVITAPLAKIDGKTWQGATYVFSLSGTTWVQVQKLLASDGHAFATFGTAVAVNAKYIFVGAGGVFQAGHYLPRSVYIFRFLAARSGNSWLQSQKLDAPNPGDATSSFGTSMAIADAVALVGARSATVEGALGRGLVYSYTETSGIWTLKKTLIASDGAVRDNFGVSIAFSGTSALIGSPGVFKGTLGVGAVYQFDYKDGDWLQAQEFHAMDAAAFDFGASVSMFGKTALIGAYAADGYRGTAYIFQQQAGVWTQVQQLKASDAAPGQVFGHATALGRTTAVVGAFTATVGGNVEQGAVYFYNAPQGGGPGLGST